MRKYLVAGNWKMNPPGDPLPLLREMKVKLVGMNTIELLVAPPFTAIHQAADILKGTKILLAGQNLYWEEKGAFTGEISVSMLKAAGATHVIIGHSERRQYFGESDFTVNRRLKTALAEGLIPIVCIGETEAEREKEMALQVLERQFKGAFEGLSESELDDVIIAYEPVWAIGTGKVAKPGDAQQAHEFIRHLIWNSFSPAKADSMRILYGGSVKPENAYNLFDQVDVDGALVGGASLSAESFAGIAEMAMKLA